MKDSQNYKQNELNSDMILGFLSVSASSGHGSQQTRFEHKTRKVISESWFCSSGRQSNTNIEEVDVPESINTLTELVEFLNNERPMWCLNNVEKYIQQSKAVNSPENPERKQQLNSYAEKPGCYKRIFDVWHTLCIDISDDSAENRLNAYVVVTTYLDRMRKKITRFLPGTEYKNFYVRIILYDVLSVEVVERIFRFDDDKYELLMFLQRKMLLETRKTIRGSSMGLEAILKAFSFDNSKKDIFSDDDTVHLTYRNAVLVVSTHETALPSVELSEMDRDFEREALCILVTPDTKNWQNYVDTVSNVCCYYQPISELVEDIRNKSIEEYSDFNSLYNVFDPEL